MYQETFIIVVSGLLAFCFGDFTQGLEVLTFFVITDYVTGIIAAWMTGVVSSRIGFKGIMKKILLFIAVAMCFQLDKLFATGTLIRDTMIYCCIGNEGISIIENFDRAGLKVPKFIRDKFIQLTNSDISSNEKPKK